MRLWSGNDGWGIMFCLMGGEIMLVFFCVCGFFSKDCRVFFICNFVSVFLLMLIVRSDLFILNVFDKFWIRVVVNVMFSFVVMNFNILLLSLENFCLCICCICLWIVECVCLVIINFFYFWLGIWFLECNILIVFLFFRSVLSGWWLLLILVFMYVFLMFVCIV